MKGQILFLQRANEHISISTYGLFVLGNSTICLILSKNINHLFVLEEKLEWTFLIYYECISSQTIIIVLITYLVKMVSKIVLYQKVNERVAIKTLDSISRCLL